MQYTFYLRTNLYDIVNISLTTNYIDSEPFTKIIAFESVDNMAAFIKNTTLTLNTSKEGDQLASIGSYRISEDCGFLLTLKAITNFGINYINVKMDIESTLVNIYKNEKISPIKNLKAGRDYYVCMKYLNDAEKLKITLEMSNKDENSFELFIY